MLFIIHLQLNYLFLFCFQHQGNISHYAFLKFFLALENKYVVWDSSIISFWFASLPVWASLLVVLAILQVS